MDLREAPPSQEAPAASGRFSPAWTAFSALVLLFCIGLIMWVELSVPPLARMAAPERALGLIAGRTMELEEAVAAAAPWERLLYEISSGGTDERAQLITWYDELTQYSQHPLIALHLAILQAEADRLEAVKDQTAGWGRRPEPYPTFKRLLSAAYLGAPPARDDGIYLIARLAELTPDGWFYERLAARLADRTGLRTLQVTTEQELRRRGNRLLARFRLLAAVDLVLLIAGSLAIIILVRGRRVPGRWTIGTAEVPPPWTGWVGAAVLLRGGAIGTVLTVSLVFLIVVENPVIRLLASPIIHLPLLLLAYVHLLRPAGVGFLDGLGLRAPPQGWPRLLVVVLTVLAAAILGEWLISATGEFLKLSSHWTEWFDPDLLWGGRGTVGAALVEYVCFAPFFEEIVFRGLIFRTFRRQFNWTMSAGASAAIFSILHGYGPLGFASVLWSGILWAWAYEKTGSLLPGMIAHAINNFLVVLGLLILLRLA